MHPFFHALRNEWQGRDGCQPSHGQGYHAHQGREHGHHFGGRGFFGGGHFGGGPFGGAFGAGGPFGGRGGPFGPRRGQRVKRGDVRLAILALLAEQPRNGYQLIQEISERSGGVWKPSPGSIYPALQQLEDEGLVRAEENEGKRQFILTEAGELYVREQPEEAAPWESMAEQVPEGHHELHALLGQIMGAGMTVAHAGTESQLERAKQLLNQTRRSLYQILAEEE